MDSWAGPNTHGTCPHCGTYVNVIFKPKAWDVHLDTLFEDEHSGLVERRAMHIAQCPKCKDFIVDVLNWMNTIADGEVTAWRRLYPSQTRAAPAEVPVAIRRDYAEARSVAGLSPRSAAALARRCLQAALHDRGFKAKTLEKEIEGAEASGGVPSTLIQKLHIVRMVGNYAVHETATPSGTLLDVEPGEVEALVAALDEFFDHFYVRPAKHKAMLDAVNAKLTAANKPPIT